MNQLTKRHIILQLEY